MKNVLIICGGMSAEHEVSILSAKSIILALDRLTYQPIPVVVSRTGTWYWLTEQALFDAHAEYQDDSNLGDQCTLMRQVNRTVLKTHNQEIPIDIAFPLIHGPMGEDGTLQGLLELMSIPYVGSGVLASAIGMDKDTLKKMFAQNGLKVAPFVTLTKDSHYDYDVIRQQLNSNILFVKPSVMGSSVGISKVKTKDQFKQAVEQAFRYDLKVLVEKFIPGREMECSVLGNDKPITSIIGEIKPNHEFYSYEAKYLDDKGADLIIPADIPEPISNEIRDMAIHAFQTIGCKGFARVDFFLSEDNKVYVNELNTIPGFTSISMYPKLWQATGMNYTELVTRLLAFALENFAEKRSIMLRPEIEFAKKNAKSA